SRRRHTRCLSDWSSDVCSSDLTPLPVERDPRAVFERLFGTSGSTDQAARMARLQRDRTILDAVGPELRRLQGILGPGDRAKVSEIGRASCRERVEIAVAGGACN